jgi:hypothetical protein
MDVSAYVGMIPGLGVAVAMASVIYASAVWLNKTASDSIRKPVADWLRGIEGTASWPETAGRLLDFIFGRLWSLRRALTLSLGVVLLSAIVHLRQQFSFVGWSALSFSGFNARTYTTLWVITWATVVPLEFALLAKTRWLFGRLGRMAIDKFAVLAILADAACNILPAFLVSAFYHGYSAEHWMRHIAVSHIYGREQNFVPSFVTYIWARQTAAALDQLFVGWISYGWLFIALVSIIVLLLPKRLGRRFLSRRRIEEEPVLILGEALTACVVIVICMYVLIGTYAGPPNKIPHGPDPFLDDLNFRVQAEDLFLSESAGRAPQVSLLRSGFARTLPTR